MIYNITVIDVQNNILDTINEYTAELKAIQAVKIDTTHKVLTNKCISGSCAILRNASYSMHDKYDKELSVSYTINTRIGSIKYQNRTITARVYTGTSTGILKDIRPMTPVELNDQLTDIKDKLANDIAELNSEYKRASSIVKKHNDLVVKINAFNDCVSYASKARF